MGLEEELIPFFVLDTQYSINPWFHYSNGYSSWDIPDTANSLSSYITNKLWKCFQKCQVSSPGAFFISFPARSR